MHSSSNNHTSPAKSKTSFFGEHRDGKEKDVNSDGKPSFQSHFGQIESSMDVELSKHPNCYYPMKDHDVDFPKYTPRTSNFRLTETSLTVSQQSSWTKCSPYSSKSDGDDNMYSISEPFTSLISDRQISFRINAPGGLIVPASNEDLYGLADYKEYKFPSKDVPPTLACSRSFFTRLLDMINRRIFHERILSPLTNVIRSVYELVMGQSALEDSTQSQMCVSLRKNNIGRSILGMLSYFTSLMWNGFIVMGGGSYNRRST